VTITKNLILTTPSKPLSPVVLCKKDLIFQSMEKEDFLKIGACSWKYESWQGLVYSQDKQQNYLKEYSKYFHTVEIDQWFWSLFKGNAVILPKAEVVREYAASVPPGFIFSIKVPNSITLTHQYNKQKNTPLVPNPYFLSTELM